MTDHAETVREGLMRYYGSNPNDPFLEALTALEQDLAAAQADNARLRERLRFAVQFDESVDKLMAENARLREEHEGKLDELSKLAWLPGRSPEQQLADVRAALTTPDQESGCQHEQCSGCRSHQAEGGEGCCADPGCPGPLAASPPERTSE